MSIDSSPRGLPAYVKTEGIYQLIGETPFFYDTTVAPYHLIYLQYDPSGTAKKIKIHCDLRWQEALIPDLGILGIGLATGGANWVWGGIFLGNDYLRDTLYDCEQHVTINLPETIRQNRVCNKFIVLPPQHDSPLVAEKIVNEWRIAIKDKLGDCDVIMFDGDSLDNLAKFNVDNVRQIPIDKFTPKQLLKIGLDSQATHLVQIQLKDVADKVQAKARAFDLHTKVFSQKYATSFTVPGEHAVDKTFLQSLGHYFNFFPNAFTLGASSSGLDEVEDISIVRKKERNIVPRYLSGIGINSIEHPLGYAPWDFTKAIYPSLLAQYESWEYDITPKCSEAINCPTDIERRTFSYFYLLPLLNGGITLHTPAGAFGIALNLGPLFASIRENNKPRRNGLGSTMGVSYGWYGFMSERYYLFANISFNTIPADLTLKDHLIQNEDQLSLNKATIGIGYFAPEFRRSLSNIFYSFL